METTLIRPPLTDLRIVGGNLALDFVNTCAGPRHGPADAEWLSSYEDFAAWSRHADVGNPSAAPSETAPRLAAIAALLLFGLFVAITGRDPIAVYYQMYRGSFGTWFSFQNTLLRAAPLMLTALATALPLRLGLVVLGGEGAMVLGGLAAAAFGVVARTREQQAVELAARRQFFVRARVDDLALVDHDDAVGQ